MVTYLALIGFPTLTAFNFIFCQIKLFSTEIFQLRHFKCQLAPWTAEVMAFKYAQHVNGKVLVVRQTEDVMNLTSPVAVAARAKRDVASPAIPALMAIN